jgi:hypothetical protein
MRSCASSAHVQLAKGSFIPTGRKLITTVKVFKLKR